jgi:DNA polymerase-3 subunit gamma/tau
LKDNGVQQPSSAKNPSEDVVPSNTEVEIELTNENALQGVKQFAELKLQSGNRQLYATLTSSKISFQSPTILIELNNEVQREMLIAIRQDMLDELRTILKNKQTQLEIKVLETVDSLKAYKPMDKFKLMSEKNPMLLELKKRFDLDIEY